MIITRSSSQLVILNNRPICVWHPRIFDVSFMKMPISCLLKSIVFMKYFESDFLEK